MNKLLLRLLLVMGLLSTFHAATIPSALQSLLSSTNTCPITLGGTCSKVVPAITFVSTDSLTQGASYRVGSPSGNVLLYLKGTGLSANAGATEVLIGGKTCTIEPMFTSVLQIACRVPASSSFGVKDITVTISSQKATCDSSICNFKYDLSQAPILSYLVPNAINPGTNIAFGGVLRTSTSSSIELKVGNYFCNLNVVGSQTYSPNTLDFGRCNIGPLPAGNYNTALTVSGKGTAFQVNTAYNKADDKGNTYNMTIIPQVSSLNSNQGKTSGQVLTILGNGFSNIPSENEVFYGETPCVVMSSEYNSIQCNLIKPSVITQTGLKPGHAGLRRRTFAAKASLQLLQQSQEFTTNGGTKSVLLSAETDYNRADDFSEVIEGFFRAPATGTHKFMISAGGAAQLYVSSVPLTKDNLALAAEVKVGTDLRDFYDPSEDSQISQGIQLTEGQYYFIQAIHLGVGEEHLTVGVIVPGGQQQQEQVNSPKKVLSIKVDAEVIKQTGTLKIKKSLLPIQFGTRKLTSIIKGLGFSFPGSNSDVETELASIGIPVKILNRTLIGLGGIVVSSSLLALEVHYSVEFVNTSSLTATTKPLGYPSGYVEITLDNTPTSLLKGYFEVGLGGATAMINYDESSDSLRDILLSLPGVGIPRIARHGDCFKGCEWIVQFDANLCDLPLLQISSQGTLAGGKSGSLSVNINLLQGCGGSNGANSELIFAPIPYDMLFTAESVPQITVKTSGFLASCLESQCDYTVEQAVVPTIIDFTLQGQTLEIFLQNGQDLTVEQLDVFFADVKCQVTSYDSQAQKIVAEVSINDSGSLMVVAGIHIPQVVVNSVEILEVSQDVVGKTFLPSITQVEVYTQAIKDGFLGFSLTGSGFGYCMDNPYGTTVDVGGVPCGIIALTNEWVFCVTGVIVPSGLVNLTVNDISTNFTLNIGGDGNTPQELEIVNKVVDSDSGEVTLVLNGDNFDNTTNVAVLNNQTGESITCSICSYTTTSLTCLTPALAPGNYSVIANTFLPPDSVSQLTTIITIDLEITSIEPHYGSQLGGTVINITGKGFSTIVNDNQVSLGIMNYRCDVFDATETSIKCTTTPNTYSSEGAQTVAVLQRLEYIAQCKGDCDFYYSNQYTPAITSLDHTSVLAGDHLAISGRNFSATTQVTIAGVLADVVSVSSEEIVIEVPEVAAGAGLAVSAYDPAFGNFAILSGLSVSHALQVTDYSPKIGSLAGTVLTVTGKGFDNTAIVTVGGKVCSVLSVSTTTVTCRSTAGSQGAVVVTQGTYKVTANGNYANQQASTPVITSIANIPTTAASEFTITFQGQALNLDSSISVTLATAQLSYTAQIVSSDASSIQAKFTQVSAGNYSLTVQVGAYIAKFDSSANFAGYVNVAMNIDSVTAVTTSIAGGVELELTGAGFTNNTDVISVQIEGFDCAITSTAFDQVNCVIPPLTTEGTQTLYKFGQEAILTGTYFSNASNENPESVFDNTTVTYFKANSTQAYCAFGLDLGTGLIAQLTQIQYFPKAGIDTTNLAGSVFEASVDGVQYSTIHILESNIYEGWNTISSPMEGQTASGFRYIRFRRDVAVSKCEIAEVRVKGILLSSLTVANSQVVQASATVSVNGKSTVISNAVEYRADQTPIVTEISPKNGSSKGNTVLHIYGTNLADTTEVKIDNIICDVTSVSASEIVCTTRPLPPINERKERVTGLINVKADGKGMAVSTGVSFLYAEKWSDRDTWGCGGFPKEYDSVHVETGMNLLIDVSPPRLVAVIVEGALIFEDADINFQAEYVLIRNGFLQIGTEDQPIQSKINITLCGEKANPQLPIFGDKVIGLYEGTVDIHGAPRDVSTNLVQTAMKGETTIQVTDSVDWQVGERIAISSTSYDATQTEEKTIISINGNTIELDGPLNYTHLVRATDVVGEEAYEINAEVILLSRNIMIQGDVNSDAKAYGAHLLFYDPGTESTIVRISYTEITKAGQAGFLGRFPINFQHAGNQMRSYVRGNSIHHTYQRGIQIQGTDYLTVEKNALFAVQGYGINIEDGIERFNLFQDNIVMSCRSTLQYLSTQENAIGFRISNPTNFFIGNKVIANPSFGFWFDLKSSTSGAYASSKICPRGERLGSFENNTGSWNNYGIKFDNYLPRTYPCRQTQYSDQPNPFEKNQPIPAVFKNNYLIGNSYKGVEASYVGAVVFDGLKVIESGFAGIDIIFADESPINGTVICNSVFIGSTKPETSQANYRGIRLTRSEGLYINNTVFVNYTSTKAALEIDSMYWNSQYYDSGARTVFVGGLSFINVVQRVKFYNSSTHIIRDTDGSLTDIVGGGTVVNDLPHLNGIVGCSSNSTTFGGLVCNSSTEFRRIVLYEAVPNTIYGLKLRVLRLDSSVNETTVDDSNYTSLIYRYGRAPVKSYALPFGVGHAYKVFFEGNTDFTNITVELSPHWTPADASLTLKFNHTAPREDYDLKTWDRILGNANIENSTALWGIYDTHGGNAKLFGDWYHDVNASALYVNVIGGNGTKAMISGFTCRVNCPAAPGAGPKVTVYWSNSTIWPNQVLPKAGENVFVPGNWTLILDMNPPALATVEIQGDLVFDDTRGENVFTAEKIWVRGRLVIGTEDQPFGQKAKIVLTGNRNASGLLINSQVDAGTKVLGVTGQLLIYGKEVTEKVSLIETVYQGNKTIRTSGGIVGWQAGNFIAITSSQKDSMYEIFEIDSIEGENITVKASAQYVHYSGVFNSSDDADAYQVDFSTEVILLDRNISIQGSNEDNWGARVLVTEEYYDTYTQTGRAVIQYASFDYCGQYSSKACLSFELMSNSTQDTTTIIVGTIMTESLAWAVRFVQSQNIVFTRNVILKSDQFGIFFDDGNYDISIVDNRVYNVAFDSTKVYAYLNGISSGIYVGDLTSNSLTINNNIVAGCDIGYVLKASVCGSDNPYTNNVAHSSNVGFIIVTDENKCAEISGLTAYRTNFGIISYFSASQIIARNLILTDNEISLNLNAVGKDSTTKLVTVRDSLFAAFSMLDCPECYSTAGSCQNKSAIMLGVATLEGKQMPPRVQDRPWNLIWSSATFDSEQVFTNNTFVNFKDGLLPQCYGNYILKTNPEAADYTPIATFESTHAVRVSNKSLAYFDIPVAEERCGNIACTGLKNVLIKDVDGTLLGNKGSIIPNNAGVVDKTCTLINSGNGYYICQNATLSILQFESLDADKNTRIISPVNVSNSNGYTNILNAFKAHDYMTNHLYTRLARFASIIQNNQNYDIEFSGTLPTNLQFQIDGAESTDFAILKVKFFEPKVVSIVNALTGDFIHPVPYEFNTSAAIQTADPCGTNYYDRNDNTINFKITADPNCKLYIKKMNVLAVNIRYDMTEAEFFQQGGSARFIDKVASILKISHSRIRVISITKGSVILDVEVLADSDESTAANNQLDSYGNLLDEAYQSGGLSVYGSAAVLNYSHRKVLVIDDDGSTSVVSQGNGLVIGLVIGGLVVALIAVSFLAYRYKKKLAKRKVMTQVRPEPKEIDNIKNRFKLLENNSSRHLSRKNSAEDMVIMDFDNNLHAKRSGSDETKNISYENSPDTIIMKKDSPTIPNGTTLTVDDDKKSIFGYSDRKTVKKSRFGGEVDADDDVENIDV